MLAVMPVRADQAIEAGDASQDRSSVSVGTTLYDLITVLQDTVAPGKDHLVIAVVDHWVQAGRITRPPSSGNSANPAGHLWHLDIEG